MFNRQNLIRSLKDIRDTTIFSVEDLELISQICRWLVPQTWLDELGFKDRIGLYRSEFEAYILVFDEERTLFDKELLYFTRCISLACAKLDTNTLWLDTFGFNRARASGLLNKLTPLADLSSNLFEQPLDQNVTFSDAETEIMSTLMLEAAYNKDWLWDAEFGILTGIDRRVFAAIAQRFLSNREVDLASAECAYSAILEANGGGSAIPNSHWHFSFSRADTKALFEKLQSYLGLSIID